MYSVELAFVINFNRHCPVSPIFEVNVYSPLSSVLNALLIHPFCNSISILLNGIKVFVSGNTNSGDITDPNRRFRDDMTREEDEKRERDAYEEELRNSRDERQNDRRSIFDITDMSDQELIRRTRGERDFQLEDYIRQLNVLYKY